MSRSRNIGQETANMGAKEFMYFWNNRDNHQSEVKSQPTAQELQDDPTLPRPIYDWWEEAKDLRPSDNWTGTLSSSEQSISSFIDSTTIELAELGIAGENIVSLQQYRMSRLAELIVDRIATELPEIP